MPESGNAATPSPLDRARTDPVAALALLVEACDRGEANLRPYLDAGAAAVEHASKHLILRVPENALEGVSDLEAWFKDKPSPSLLYKQTGGGQAYINAMIAHGYVIPKEKK